MPEWSKLMGHTDWGPAGMSVSARLRNAIEALLGARRGFCNAGSKKTVATFGKHYS